MINWDSEETYWMVNPQLSDWEQRGVAWAKEKAPGLEAHVWIRSSGTSASKTARWVALSKSAFLVSAAAVNEHLNSTHTDTWGLALPDFHVGGLSIMARSHLSGARVAIWKEVWDPVLFHQFLDLNAVTLLSLVPTQLFDLVKEELVCPQGMRAVIIGGAALSRDLYYRARELRWPVLPSYGLTEAASQVATADMDSLLQSEYPKLKVLNHISPSVSSSGELLLQSKSLFTVDLMVDLNSGVVKWSARDQKSAYATGDLVTLNKKGYLEFQGRTSQMVKVLGEQVSMQKLSELVQKSFVNQSLDPFRCFILPVPHARKGTDLVLVTDLGEMPLVENAVSEFHGVVEKYERLSAIYFVPKLLKSDLGKPKIKMTLKQLGFLKP